jgi:hypothetical protein
LSHCYSSGRSASHCCRSSIANEKSAAINRSDRLPKQAIYPIDPKATANAFIAMAAKGTKKDVRDSGVAINLGEDESSALRSYCRPLTTDAISLFGGEGLVSQTAACAAFLAQKVSALPA